MKSAKRTMALLLVFAGLSWAQAFAEKDYKQLILGKWRGVGRQCDSAGNCKESVVDNIALSFFRTGHLQAWKTMKIIN